MQHLSRFTDYRLAPLAIALFMFVGIGCGSAETTNSKSQTKDKPVQIINIVEVDYELKPSNLNLAKPGKYRFEALNAGENIHALKIEGQGVEEEIDGLYPNEIASIEVDLQPGSYELYCPLSRLRGTDMEGSIKVREG